MEKRRSQKGISFKVVDHLDQPPNSSPLCPQCQTTLKDVPDTTDWHCLQCQEYFVVDGMSYDYWAKGIEKKWPIFDDNISQEEKRKLIASSF